MFKKFEELKVWKYYSSKKVGGGVEIIENEGLFSDGAIIAKMSEMSFDTWYRKKIAV